MTNSKEAREVLLSIYSDVHKDVFGFRPRGAAFPDDLSDEEIQAKLDDLQERLEEQLLEEPDYIPGEDMDGDHESGLASCGWGTDEDYGCYGSGDEW